MISNQIFDVSIPKSELRNLFDRFSNHGTILCAIPATPNGAGAVLQKYTALQRPAMGASEFRQVEVADH
jgi:hypothetical protein